MLPKVRKSAQGCSKCKILLLQTQKGAQILDREGGKVGVTQLKLKIMDGASKLLNSNRCTGSPLEMVQF